MPDMPIAAAAIAALGGLALSACATASSEVTTALAPELAQDGFVREVHVTAAEDAGVSADFAAAMARELEAELAKCATGQRPLRMDVTLDRIKRSNPLKSAILTDTNEVSGTVVIYALETGEEAGAYRVDWQNRGGLGAGGALMMTAMSSSQLTDGFADEICRRAFEGGEEDSVQSVRLF